MEAVEIGRASTSYLWICDGTKGQNRLSNFVTICSEPIKVLESILTLLLYSQFESTESSSALTAQWRFGALVHCRIGGSSCSGSDNLALNNTKIIK